MESSSSSSEGHTGPRTYEGERIAVTFDSVRCLHAAECIRGLPEVFDLAARPWVQPDAAPHEDVASVIRRCPSGALTYRSADLGDELAPLPTSIARTAGGRIYVHGDLAMGSGDERRHLRRAILCGCDSSRNLPYCDGAGRCRDEAVRDPHRAGGND